MMKTYSWVYHTPRFESDQYNPEMMKYSPWSGHRYFGYDYIANIKPRLMVELGSYYGCSAFTFLQAVKDFELQAEFYAVDTWSGDSFTVSDYQENIYDQYKRIQEACFSNQKAHMLRMTFDEAVESFKNETIDLLHIDGSHAYEDVKHDFLTWKNKVKKSGVIFFHDISSDKLFGKTLGSHLFWEELKKEYPYIVEFSFSFGLGILFFDRNQYERFRQNVDLEHYQYIVNHSDVENKDIIRKNYFEIRDLHKYVESLKEQIQICQNHLNKYKSDTDEKDKYISQLEKQVKELTDECRGTFETTQKAIRSYERDNKAHLDEIREKEKYIAELRTAIASYDTDAKAKEAYIEDLEKKVSDLTDNVRTTYEDIQKLNNEYQTGLASYQDTLSGKESYISELNETIAGYKLTVTAKDNYISELQKTIESYKENVAGKDDYISQLKQTIDKYENTVSGKNDYILELQDTIKQYQHTVDGKDQYITELKSTIQKYKDTSDKKDNYISELQTDIDKINRDFDSKNEYISQLQAEKEQLAAQNLADQEQMNCLRKSVDEARSITEQMRSEMASSLWGRHILKRMEQKNGQTS